MAGLSWFTGMLGRNNGLLLAGAVLLVLGLVMLVLTLNAFLSVRPPSRTSARRRTISPGSFLVRMLAVVAFLFLATSILLTGVALRTYTAFTHEDLAGILECLQVDPANQVMIVRFTPITKGREGRAQTFTLSGDRWEIGAHIMKWTPRTIQLGVHTAYRLDRIQGAYQQIEDENQRPHQAVSLSPGRDWVWSLLTRYGQHLPFIEAVYGNSVSNPAQPGDRYEIRVTTSGLSAQRR